MKKAIMKVILIAMTLVTLLTVIPLSASASSSNKTEVFSYLTNELGFNSAAACGIMANIEKESNFKSSTIIRDSNGLLSGGLCMWNGSRLNNLKNYCSKNGYNYLSIKGQLNYLEHELKSSRYNHIYKYLKNVSNTSGGAYDAAYYWCYYFEIPANRASKASQRGNSAAGTYWRAYGNKTLEKPELSFLKDKTEYDLDSTITLQWTSGGKNADVYKVYVAEKLKKTGKYDWEHSKIYTTSALKQKISTNYLGAGNYSVFVKAVNEATENYKNSNYLTFTIDCLTHEYKKQVTKNPTLTQTGEQLLTCKECGFETKKVLDKLTPETLGDYPMTDIKVLAGANTESSITLEWDKYEGADGYYIYLRENNKWVLVGTTENTEFAVTKLESATEYKFAVQAFVKHEGKTYRTYCSNSVVSSTKTEPLKITSASSNDKSSATLKWDRDKKATGYAIYVSDDGGRTFEKKAVIKNNKTCTYTFDDLKAGRIYLFKVHTYISTEGHNIYSAPSNIALVRVSRV